MGSCVSARHIHYKDDDSDIMNRRYYTRRGIEASRKRTDKTSELSKTKQRRRNRLDYLSSDNTVTIDNLPWEGKDAIL